jgi:hypothetical protein
MAKFIVERKILGEPWERSANYGLYNKEFATVEAAQTALELQGSGRPSVGKLIV